MLEREYINRIYKYQESITLTQVESEVMWSPRKPFPPETGQTGDGEPCGLRTGAKALFCLAEGGKDEKDRREVEELDPGTVGLDGMTVRNRSDHASCHD